MFFYRAEKYQVYKQYRMIRVYNNMIIFRHKEPPDKLSATSKLAVHAQILQSDARDGEVPL